MEANHQTRKKNILFRLRRISGQVQALERMVEEDRYCIDVLMQISAVRAALRSVGLLVIEGHANACFTSAIQQGKGETATKELLTAMERFMKG
jgi:DNA-binding FrmR family transcriptional regulator